MSERQDYEDPEIRQEQVERCRRLAKATTDGLMRFRLLALAEELERNSTRRR